MARYPWFYPATIECTWTLVRLGQWNEASEMADGILQADSQCIDALSIKGKDDHAKLATYQVN